MARAPGGWHLLDLSHGPRPALPRVLLQLVVGSLLRIVVGGKRKSGGWENLYRIGGGYEEVEAARRSPDGAGSYEDARRRGLRPASFPHRHRGAEGAVMDDVRLRTRRTSWPS